MKIRLVGREIVSYARTDTTKIIAAFRNSVKARKNDF